ncbi:MAG TPA: peptidoglycan-binding protein [Methyloceanibacter sp.]|nr:peptidoglycan-binding protein [Methyloceanibacter sp.]
MVSDASWHTGSYGNAPSKEGPMDQQSVESLLRRLVQRVEESERRYSEALDELHARLDQLAQRTDAARAAPIPDDAATFDRLQDEVSTLAKRLELEASNPLDDFERLGRALAGDLNYAASLAGAAAGAKDALGNSAFSGPRPSEPPVPSSLPYGFPLPEINYASPPLSPSSPGGNNELDSRLAEMAQRLEHSVAPAMPPALDALSARLDEISRDLAKALATPTTLSLEPVERQISDMAQQLNRAEAQLAKIGEIESALLGLIERVDASPSPEDVAEKAADEAARRVADAAKLGTVATERLDAVQRDLAAMSDRTKSSDDKLAGAIEAVHASLKKLAQQVDHSAPAPTPPPAPLPAAKPRIPFAERMRDLDPLTGMRNGQEGDAPKSGGVSGSETKDAAEKTKPATVLAEEEPEIAPRFGRARRGLPGEQAFDPDAPTPRRAPGKARLDAEYEIPNDLVAAARRAAQAAAAKAEERGSGTRIRRLPGDGEPSISAEVPPRRKRSFLIICAAVLLAISAALLYSRLRSKPEPEVTPPVVEQSAPVPAAPSEGAGSAATDDGAPAAVEPKADTPATPGSSELQWEPEVTPAPADAAAIGATGGNYTDVAKSRHQQPEEDETEVQAQPASLTQDEMPALPPGVVFSVEDPTLGAQGQAPVAPQAPAALPMSLPLPPPDLGPMPLRQAAAEGDARAQYAIALRYAQGEGTAQNLTEAARWLERAASAGLAPAQYRLAALYERGQGVAKDLARARSWYQAAAEKGNVKAMHNLAVSVSGRQDGSADYALAAKWYGEAAAYGLADSQFNLGVLEEHGLGMPKNLSAAYKWFALAAKNGDPDAAKRRDQVKPQLDSAALAAAEQAIAAWAPKQAPAEANEVDQAEAWANASNAPNTALVNRAQALLNKLGYDVGAPDGLMGAKTRDAIKSFERRNGLEETGKVTIPLVAKLERLTS